MARILLCHAFFQVILSELQSQNSVGNNTGNKVYPFIFTIQAEIGDIKFINIFLFAQVAKCCNTYWLLISLVFTFYRSTSL